MKTTNWNNSFEDTSLRTVHRRDDNSRKDRLWMLALPTCLILWWTLTRSGNQLVAAYDKLARLSQMQVVEARELVLLAARRLEL